LRGHRQLQERIATHEKERRAIQTIMEQKIKALTDAIASVAVTDLTSPTAGARNLQRLVHEVHALQRLVNASIAALRSASASLLPCFLASLLEGPTQLYRIMFSLWCVCLVLGAACLFPAARSPLHLSVVVQEFGDGEATGSGQRYTSLLHLLRCCLYCCTRHGVSARRSPTADQTPQPLHPWLCRCVCTCPEACSCVCTPCVFPLPPASLASHPIFQRLRPRASVV
jgi:hypothetical protein